MSEYVTKPLLKLSKKGHADILFVLPYEQRQFDENVLSNQQGKELKEIIEDTFDTYAVVTLKKTSGPWSDQNIEPHVVKREGWLKRKIEEYTPNVVVFLGVNIARFLIPKIRDVDAFNLVSTFQKWKLSSDHTQLCYIYTQVPTIFKDYEQRSRLNETIAKLYVASRGREYHKVGDYENMNFKSARNYLKFLIHDHDKFVAFDTETYSLNQVHNTRLGAMQFSHNTSESKVMLWDTDKSPYSESEKEQLTKLLVKLFSSKNTALEGWIMHNAIFDMNQVRGAFKVRFPYEKIIRDTWLRTHLLDENRISRGDKFALKLLSKEFFGFDDYDNEALEARSNGVIMELPTKKLVKYAGNDTVCTYRLDKVLEVWAKLDDYYESLTKMTNYLHNPALRLYSEMKVNGMLIDMYKLAELLAPTSVIKKRLREINEEYKTFKEVRAVNDEIYMEQVGKKKLFRVPFVFDMGKPTYRNALFFHSENGYKYPPTGKDEKTGKPKFSSGKAFQEIYEHVNPVVKLYKESQGLAQLKKMYVQPIYLAMMNKKGDVVDGRVHPNFNLAGTVTGRLSSNDINTQQIPRSDTPTKKEIKALFIADPGFALMQADFAAAEVRMWGAMSKDPNLCKLLQESFIKRAAYRKKPDDEKLKVAAELMGDVHKQTASLMFGVDLYSVNWKDKQYKDMRQTTKSITFGLMYGRGTPSVAQQINKEVEETEALKAKFFDRFKAGEAWLERQKKDVKQYGYVETPLGRRRRCPAVFSGDKKLVKEAERFAVNAPIQATASDYAALATSLLHKYFVENDLTDKFKIINAVHDSVVIQFPANRKDMAFLARLIREIYTVDVQDVLKRDFKFTLLAPMDIDLEVSYNKYKKCKKCGATHMMSEVICDNAVDKGKKDKDGKPVKEPCLSEKFDIVNLRHHAYGYLNELVETKQGFADAALAL